MKIKTTLALCASFALAGAAFAQTETKPARPQPTAEQKAALLAAFDADKDGKLSPEELAAARAALRASDTRQTGATEKFRGKDDSQKKPRGEGKDTYGQKDRKPKSKDKDKDSHDDDDDDAGAYGSTEKGGATGQSAKVAQLLAFDKNADGKLAASEVPARVAKIVTEADTDKDGFATAAELEAWFAKQGNADAASAPKEKTSRKKDAN